MSAPTNREMTILLVEDDEIDAEAVQRAFRQRQVPHRIIAAVDGVEALAILQGTPTTPPLEHPYLILLDLNLPRMNGIDFLQQLRQDHRLRDALVFVLTTSNAERDKNHAYGYHIAGYLVKSRISPDYPALVDLLHLYWKLVEFPPAPPEK